MAEYTWPVAVIHQVWCDSCDRTEESGQISADINHLQEYIAELVAEGWSVYSGRSRRHYCPDPNCGPRPGHKMRLVAGRETTVAVRATATTTSEACA
jgi:hypothetical protein